MMKQKPQMVDQNGLKTGQALTILLLIAAFVFDSWLLAGIVAVCQLLGAFAVSFAPYRLFYQRLIKAGGFVQANMQPDNPEPHRFAMLIGALFNGAATAALLLGLPIIGWILVGIVIVLANLNFWLNFCLGCWVYYRLNRFGVPGFTQAPVQE